MTFATTLPYFCGMYLLKHQNQEVHLTFLLGQTVSLIKQKLVSRFRENNLDLTMEQYVILHFINNKENLTQQDIANHFLRDKSIILRQVNSLIEQQYVARATDKTDKRKKNLMLTEKGKEMMRVTLGFSKELSSELLEGVTEEELSHLKTVISKIQLNTGFTKCITKF